MKKITVLLAVLAFVAVANQVSAQTGKEIRKEVNLEEENGVKTLTIKTTTDGNTSTEVFTGAEADAKIAEFDQEKSGTTKTMIMGSDGKKHMKVEKRIVIKDEHTIDE